MLTGGTSAEFHPLDHARTAQPMTAAEEGPLEPSGMLNRSSSVSVKPACSIAATVSRETWQPPKSRGHTVASSPR